MSNEAQHGVNAANDSTADCGAENNGSNPCRTASCLSSSKPNRWAAKLQP